MGKKKKEPKYLRLDSNTAKEEYKNNENRFRFSFVSKSILVISESGMKSVLVLVRRDHLSFSTV